MADNPYSPYVDRTGGSTGWGANPTNKRGPQFFPPLPAFKPYANVASANSGMPSMLSAAVSRLRTNPAVASGAGSGSGGAGRGADSSGMSVQGIQGVQGIPTLGSVSGNLGVGAQEAPPTNDPTDGSISPDSQDQPPVTPTPQDPGTGTGDGADIIQRLRAIQTGGNLNGPGLVKKRIGPQY